MGWKGRNQQQSRVCTFLLLFTCFFGALAVQLNVQSPENVPSVTITEDVIIQDEEDRSVFKDDSIILVSTLEGALVAISKRSGIIRWTLKEEPVVKLPLDLSKTNPPTFLPDPKDGSLYMISSASEPNSQPHALTKMPFTIPELVASSPCRSTDGMLYTGKKLDFWFAVDPFTGERHDVLSFDGADKVCPRSRDSRPTLYIGRTEYSVTMFDSRTRERKWNVTFYDYSVNTLNSNVDYDLVHFTSSASGKLVTLDRSTGDFLWKRDLGSPIVAIYNVERGVSTHQDTLAALPFTSVAEDSLTHIIAQVLHVNQERVTEKIKFHPTLYIGEFRHGLYAIASLVDGTTSAPSLLLAGPNMLTNVSNSAIDIPRPQYPMKNLVGHYQVPVKSIVQLKPAQITHVSDANRSKLVSDPLLPLYNDTEWLLEGYRQIANWNWTFIRSKDMWYVMQLATWDQIASPKLEISLQTTFFAVFVVLHLIGLLAVLKLVTRWLQWVTRIFKGVKEDFSMLSFRSTQSNRSDGCFSANEVLESGAIQVGKLLFDPREILGKGCEGTFVYRGEFDKRQVAVKRLLPECFTFADREVALLRESDAHPHVVRYFCMEQDRQFRYIALELGQATLYDFVEGNGKYTGPELDPRGLLKQATQGLAHLHALDIVHRDIKPQNVLLSLPNGRGEVRAMISDFGLCKKLKVGRMSFSRRSGLAGTDGWIAPEMLEEGRTTCAVDVFSMGCVFYYVLSQGKHPFGDTLRRQVNILSGNYELSYLDEDKENVARGLIENMILPNPVNRPPVQAILKHPMFWTKEEILSFLQDASDRVDKEPAESAVLQSLERNSLDIVKGNWRSRLGGVVENDLKKYRTYYGRSVRDLLRALRNKRHHYRELPENVQKALGNIPDEFCDYWTSRFPKLLLHAWYAMHRVKNESHFTRYYTKEFDFLPVRRNISKQYFTSNIFSPYFLSPKPPKFEAAVRDSWESVDDEILEEELEFRRLSNEHEDLVEVEKQLKHKVEEQEERKICKNLEREEEEHVVLSPRGNLGKIPSAGASTELENGKSVAWILPTTPSDWKVSAELPKTMKNRNNHKKKRKRPNTSSVGTNNDDNF